jgi:signal peptidase I
MLSWIAVAAGVLIVAAGLASVVLRLCLAVVTVAGASMLPAFAPGDRALVRRLPLSKAAVGDVVVFREPDHFGSWVSTPQARSTVRRDQWVIKRVVARPGDEVPAEVSGRVATSVVPPGALVVLGDNADRSRDSRDWGFVPQSAGLGKVVRVLASGSGSVATNPSAVGD